MSNVVFKGRNHISFQPLQMLYNLINDNVEDINSIRKAKPTPRERQWLFASYPESNDENYPRIALVNESIRFEEYGSGRFLKYEYNPIISTKVDRMVFTKVAILPMTITLFCKRNQKHNVTYYDGTTGIVRNSKQADFLGDKIEKYIEMYREKYFIPNNMDIIITEVTRSYDDTDFLIAKSISCEIVMMDEWMIDFTDPSSTVGIINNINLNFDVQPYGL